MYSSIHFTVIRYAAPLILAFTLSSCNDEPPTTTLEAGIKADFLPGDHIVSYDVTNSYKRQVKDEVFWIYEFDINCIYAWNTFNTQDQTKRTIAFVKRGNDWQHRRWDARE